jgi:hypothetical protein
VSSLNLEELSAALTDLINPDGVAITIPCVYHDTSIEVRRIVREEYMRRQKNMCLFCASPLTGPPGYQAMRVSVSVFLFPAGFFNNPIHLHHNHKDGMTLGAVHALCNAILWEHFNE